MRPLYDFTATQVIDSIAKDVQEIHGVSKAMAKKLVINALIYNCVTDEVLGQVDFLMDRQEEE